MKKILAIAAVAAVVWFGWAGGLTEKTTTEVSVAWPDGRVVTGSPTIMERPAPLGERMAITAILTIGAVAIWGLGQTVWQRRRRAA